LLTDGIEHELDQFLNIFYSKEAWLLQRRGRETGRWGWSGWHLYEGEEL